MRNECDRHLTEAVAWHLEFLDGLFVFDDQSYDSSVAEARACGATVECRDEDTPSFLEHEGAFRQAGYEAFELAMQPLPGDWVLSIDLDEFFVADEDERESLIVVADLVDSHFRGSNAVDVPFEEIFEIYDWDRLYTRVDGFWGGITAPRFFRYELGGHIPNRQMGGGSVPSYVRAEYAPLNLRFLHLGYSSAADRAEKHERYATCPNNGHNPAHIASIVATPTLVPWSGAVPWK